MPGVPVPSGTENLVKGWAAVRREHGLSTDCSSGDPFFKPQPEYWWCMETMSNFWHIESFTRVSSRVNQNTNPRCYAQACSLDVILQRHINFKAGGELFNSPGVLWLNSPRPLFLCHAHIHVPYIYMYIYMYGSSDTKTTGQRCISRGEAFCREAVSSSACEFSSH